MNITIGIPTFNSGEYIYASLSRIQKEIMYRPLGIDQRIVVCINGTKDNSTTRQEIERFERESATIMIEVIEEERKGKNNALNRIIRHARLEHLCDIIYFFDDDVWPSKGSFATNIETLIKHEKCHGLPVLVGSAMLAISHHPSHFIRLKKSLGKGLKAYFFHWVFTLPYRPDSERPKFCEGFSVGTFIRYIPYYPDDATGITDDTFLSNYFASIGKEAYLSEGIPPIIKPPGSEAFVEIPYDYREWHRQQVRVHAGIRRSFNSFSAEDQTFLFEYFQWPYAFNRESRVWPQNIAKHRLLHYALYRLLHEHNEKKACNFLVNGNIPDWGTAVSTKGCI